ncbi:plasminogen-binding N-terminal domain-containing protein [Hydrogenimonas sp.]
MKQLMIFLSIFTLAIAAPIPTATNVQIRDVSEKSAVVDSADLIPGMSGIVIHTYDDKHSAIVATAIVTSSNTERSDLKLLKFEGLRQPRLPDIKTRPANGDTAVLGYLYDRILPIAPNQESFEKAKNTLADLTLIHPDIFATQLAQEKNPRPTKRSIQKFCQKMHLGLVMIMLKDGSDFIDCISWKKIARTKMKAVNPKKFKQPFYHRFESIPGGFFDWSDYKIYNYDRYYKKLEKK